MFKIFKKKEGEGTKSALTKGLIWGGGAAAVLVVAGLAVFFIFFRGQGEFSGQSEGLSSAGDEVKLRYTIITKKDCAGCWDINLFFDAIKGNKVKEVGRSTLYIDDAATKKIIDQYKITKIPTVLVSGDLEKNDTLKQAWSALGEIVDKVFVLRQVIPPYIDVATGELKGKVSGIFLSDTACKECYDVALHNQALTNLGVTLTDSKTIDVSSDEGKALVAKYAITAVPTLILTGEISEYSNLVQIWPQVGKIADDGTYIFTKMDEMGTYYDLTKKKVVTVTIPTTNTNTSVTPAQ
ncbi:MAG: hypothetical protein AAB358_02565 [Patescibacteria group bacterium]